MTSQPRVLPRHRALGVTWLCAAVPVAVVAFFVLVLSERTDDRLAGYALAALALAAGVVGAWLVAGDRGAGRSVSLALSAVFVVAGVVLYPTQELAADAVGVAGLPALAGLVTAAVALRSRP